MPQCSTTPMRGAAHHSAAATVACSSPFLPPFVPFKRTLCCTDTGTDTNFMQLPPIRAVGRSENPRGGGGQYYNTVKFKKEGSIDSEQKHELVVLKK